MPDKYPWVDTEIGASFFVPALDAEAIRTEGLVDGLRKGVKAVGKIGVYKRRYGVLFTRLKGTKEGLG